MATLTINTNIASIVAQRNLNNATKSMNTSIERMTTGYKINHAADNSADYSIANLWKTQLSSLDVVADNAAIGADMLTTAEGAYGLVTTHLQRVRDLTEQAANGTYGLDSLKAIQAEIASRLQEVNRLSVNSEFNGIKLMAYDLNDPTKNADVGLTAAGVDLQVGLYADDNSRINLAVDLFANASLSGLFKNSTLTTSAGKTLSDIITAAGGSISALADDANIQAFAAACAGLVYSEDDGFSLQTEADYRAKEMLAYFDEAIAEISDRVTQIGAVQNRISSALTSIDVQSQNLTSSLSTLQDTDIAKESSDYIKYQILQQSSATLLATANQQPSIALNLI